MFKKKSTSLFFKVMLLLNAFIIIPALIICFVVNYQFTQTITGEIREKLQRISEEKQSKLSMQLTNIQNTAYFLAHDNYAMDCFATLRSEQTIEPEKLRRISTNLEKIYEQGQGIYENIGYYFEGRVIVDGIGGKSTQDLLQENKTITNLIRLAPTTGRPVLVNRISYYKDSSVANTFFMAIELNNITEKIINNGQNEAMRSIILDQNGLIIASDNQEQIMTLNFKTAESDTARFFANMEQSQSGVDFLTWEGQKYLAAFSKDPIHGFYTVTYIPVSEYDQKINALLKTIITLFGLCVILGLLSSYLITKKTITNSLGKLTKGIQLMGNGDFSNTIHIESSDEIGQMGADLNNMSDRLSEMIGLAMETAEQVGSGMQEITIGNQNLSSRTQEQASTLHQISSSAEEITASIQQTALNAEQAKQLSTSTLGVVEDGEKSINATINAMQQINESSKKISDIIKVVSDIAFQTNLLALNAAVEAARAGEQGRGFAVVAAEVRNLASRTANSSKEIEMLINESVDRIERGNEAVQQSGEILQKIVQNTKHTSDVIMEIAAAIEEQSASSEQISTAIEQLNEVTQQNAALVEEITSSSEVLSSRAAELSQMMQAFKIKRQRQSNGQNKQEEQAHTLERKETATALPSQRKEPKTKWEVINDDLDQF
ncbi:MAG TPA: HAMP domain-containing protein [Firmicutes bacterium]|nr:HAMP domain-containing protein [Bacillota bacterium]